MNKDGMVRIGLSMRHTGYHMAHSNPDVFRHAMTCFARGVTAITTRGSGIPSGLVATSVSSLSVDPAAVLVCVNKTASAHDAILRTKAFAVNLVSAEQTLVARYFSSSRGADRFDKGLGKDGTTGSPTLIDAVVVFDCRLIAVNDGYTHSIPVGQVQSVEVNEDIARIASCGIGTASLRVRQGRRDLVELRLLQLSSTRSEATRAGSALAGGSRSGYLRQFSSCTLFPIIEV